MEGTHGAGKGDTYRKVDYQKWSDNWDAIFNKEKTMTENQTEKKGTCGCGRSPTGNCVGWHGLTEEEFQHRKELYETGKVDLHGKPV